MVIPRIAMRMGKTVWVVNANVLKKLYLPANERATRGMEKTDVPILNA